ncbi:hypothetical protein [Actinoplanes awajinensis]|uniref:Uncharacterized protein n=1 Tax=Actinoplanes awajinensis subsp. mycoplanecinus TaxID=135947 RepID=A0A101JAX9_9ACTN|nr:hypothetical protein [Actinoplanes awajinensis]KUL23443.1 hypothetical protein ADL15_45510 [Actinoplanes awajinensis subsp. mycoplanecinus]
MNENKSRRYGPGAGGGGAIYGLGLIGALVYYFGTAESFGNGVLGVLKSLVWPAFVVHDLLRLLGS